MSAPSGITDESGEAPGAYEMRVHGVHGRASGGETAVARTPVALGELHRVRCPREKNAKPNRLWPSDLYFRGPKC